MYVLRLKLDRQKTRSIDFLFVIIQLYLRAFTVKLARCKRESVDVCPFLKSWVNLCRNEPIRWTGTDIHTTSVILNFGMATRYPLNVNFGPKNPSSAEISAIEVSTFPSNAPKLGAPGVQILYVGTRLRWAKIPAMRRRNTISISGIVSVLISVLRPL